MGIDLESFFATLPDDVKAEDLKILVPDEMWKINPEQAAITALHRSGIFDAQAYLRENPDVKASGCSAELHFVRNGINEKRSFKHLKDSKPKVSILIPVFNNAKYLPECLGSVTDQTLKDIEIIIINDGSTDQKAVDIMNNFAKRDSRVKVIHKPNTGYGHSMNTGLKAATGQFIGIVESDDYILPDMYETYYDIAITNNLDFVKSDAQMFYGDGVDRRFEERIISANQSLYDKILDPWQEVTLFNIQNVIWNGIYKKEFLSKNNIYFNETPGASYQDNGFWFQTIMHTHRFMIVNKPMYMLRRDNPGSSFYNREKIFCMCDEYAFIEKKLRQNKIYENMFIKIFWLKKWNNYMFTFNRIGLPFKKRFVYHIHREFLQAYEKLELDKDLIGNDNYNDIMLLINDPEKFYTKKIEVFLNSGNKTILLANSTQNACKDNKFYLVSVIIPVYNSGEYLRDCLDTVINQTIKEIEIICVNDGSTDNSLEILNEYAKFDKRIKIINQLNAGAGAARNKGLTVASGEFIIFLDSDDYFELDMLENTLNKIKEDNSDFCVFRSRRFNVRTKKMENINWGIRKELLPEKNLFSPREIKRDIFKVFVGWAWDKLFRRSFVVKERLRFQEIKSSNDLGFTFMAVVKAKKISICNKYLAVHRIGHGPSVSTTIENNPLCFYEALKFLKTGLISSGLFNLYERDFVNYCVHFFLWHYSTLKDSSKIELSTIKNDFIVNMGIKKRGDDFFFNKDEYNKFTLI